MKTKFSIFSIFKALFLFIVVMATVIPFLYMISVSLSDKMYVLRNEVLFYPKGLNFEMYKYVLTDSRVYAAYLNTLIYVSVGTFISLTVTALGAYAISKEWMIFRSFFIKLMVICMFFTGGMIPTYLVIKGIGILNTRWAVILPETVSVWLFLIMMSMFRSIPKELEDASKIDGVSEVGAFWYVALPLSGAAMATIGLFYAVSYWNDFMRPLLYLNNPKLFPLTILLRDMILSGSDMANKGQASDDGGFVVVDSLKYATLMVSVIPIMCTYPFLQKYFVKGVMVGSLKG